MVWLWFDVRLNYDLGNHNGRQTSKSFSKQVYASNNKLEINRQTGCVRIVDTGQCVAKET